MTTQSFKEKKLAEFDKFIEKDRWTSDMSDPCKGRMKKFLSESIDQAVEEGKNMKGSSWREGYQRGIEEGKEEGFKIGYDTGKVDQKDILTEEDIVSLISKYK